MQTFFIFILISLPIVWLIKRCVYKKHINESTTLNFAKDKAGINPSNEPELYQEFVNNGSWLHGIAIYLGAFSRILWIASIVFWSWLGYWIIVVIVSILKQ